LNYLKKIALIIPCLLLGGLLHSQNLSVINGDTLVCISVTQMDTISSRLIRAKELPALHALLLAKNAELGACDKVVKKDEQLIDTLKAQISDYVRLSQSQEHEKQLLSGVIKQQKKSIRRVKLMTSIIAIPISLVLGTTIGFIIAK